MTRHGDYGHECYDMCDFGDPPRIDPTCTLHGKKWSEHETGTCLYCCICFEELTPETCFVDSAGDKWDKCVPCAERQLAV